MATQEFQSKLWPVHSLRRPRFPTRQMYLHYRVTFAGYIRCVWCYLWPNDLDFRPFDLESVAYTGPLMPDLQPNFNYPTTVSYWVTVTEFYHISDIWKSLLRMRCVTWLSLRGKNGPHFWSQTHFWNPWPQFTYSRCTFRALRRRLGPVIALWRQQSSLRICSIAWPVHRGSPKTTHNNFLPRIAYLSYNFFGATITITGSLYWNISMLKRFSVA